MKTHLTSLQVVSAKLQVMSLVTPTIYDSALHIPLLLSCY